ncbi:HtaA domain-containing protein [Svornostia abyssi]|uniref:HtaA domain-containing protein n=1 Tax=Svornostia abyssi TaxID=2898438 RepID=A0ABY5PHT8_9ACTN|nr:HtaA domain-containing protein [Parviterribacteraceae bacterium J379]
MTTTTRRVAGAIAAMTAAAAVAPAVTQAAVDVTSASLTWSQTNVYDTSQPTGTFRTFLGYATNPVGGPGASNGTATVSDGATLTGPAGWAAPTAPKTVIDGTSPRGIDKTYAVGYPGAATPGTYDAATAKLSLAFTGAFTYRVHPSFFPPAGAPISIENPKVEISGTTGSLVASGQGGSTLGATSPYSDTKVFDLDLRNAFVTDHVDGSTTIANIVPSIATTTVFSTSYPVGSGPNRDPATFGAFAIRVAAPAEAAIVATPVQGPKGDTGPAGPQGPAGTAGASGVATTRIYSLAKAPFGSRTVNVAVLGRKNRPLTVGTVKGKTLKVKAALAKGTYKLQRTNRFVKQRTASVKVG